MSNSEVKSPLRTLERGQPHGLELHAYGIDDEDHELLRAWQESPLPDDWRTFRLDKAMDISITAIRFMQPGLGYKRNDTAMKKKIYCQLDC
jgi:hypothetical protein